MSKLKVISSKLIYEDKWLKFFQDKIELADKTHTTYARVERQSGAMVTLVRSDNKIFLNKQYRHIIDEFSWEIPGGGIDDGETPREAAIRELREETGISVAELTELGYFYPINSLDAEEVWLFTASVSKESIDQNEPQIEDSEMIVDSRWVSFEEALVMIESGEISDAMTALAIQLAIRKKSQ